MDKINNMLTAKSDAKLMNVYMTVLAVTAMVTGIVGLTVLFWN